MSSSDKYKEKENYIRVSDLRRFLDWLNYERSGLSEFRQESYLEYSVKKTIRVEIDGNWTSEDMQVFLSSIDKLYNFRLLAEINARQQTLFSETNNYLRKMYKHKFRYYWGNEYGLEYSYDDPQEIMSVFSEILTQNQVCNYPLIEILDSSKDFLYSSEKLHIRRIEYASPGFTDLAGIGSVIAHVKDFLQFIVKEGKHWKSSREEQKLKNDEQKLKNDEQRIKNIREFVTVVKEAKEIGMSEIEVRKLINWVEEKEETIAQLVLEDKIKDVRLLESGE